MLTTAPAIPAARGTVLGEVESVAEVPAPATAESEGSAVLDTPDPAANPLGVLLVGGRRVVPPETVLCVSMCVVLRDGLEVVEAPADLVLLDAAADGVVVCGAGTGVVEGVGAATVVLVWADTGTGAGPCVSVQG